jgi:hypothetical protein
LFNAIERFDVAAQSVGGERSQPEGDLGSLLRELIHVNILLANGLEPSDCHVSFRPCPGTYVFGYGLAKGATSSK